MPKIPTYNPGQQVPLATGQLGPRLSGAGLERGMLAGVRTTQQALGAVADIATAFEKRRQVELEETFTADTINDFQENQDFFKTRETKGEKVLIYTCLVPGGKWLNRTLDMEKIRQVYFGWAGSKYNTFGYLHWGLNQYKADPFKHSVIKHPSPQASENNFSMRGIDKLLGYAQIIKDWKITNISYEELLTDSKDTFTYLDPPYAIKDNLYGNKGGMHKRFDHDDFASDCDRYIGPQLISYNSSQLVKERFQDYQTGEFDLTYTMRSVGEYMREQKERKELLLFNYEFSTDL